ncbi:type III pantothenate kinase [Helicobacter canadensis]|uniref:Type III pantothenate kinase n=1 Tax=Helicobacter canadensis MIT 98-5491 TaxID=537970 RepID=C5ZZ26_9HELI|nr:type III pantothenate kinase [Helicobacter canadensis]EES89284.1 putative transcriptional regulator [Helicobacter canadensis MIT 98-5491]EFR48070.1 pantothenate kinase [Helicobacter canadensis MIT 98-5491]STO99319.1 type III pantothenate kinase [Helicobacter canadensis]
MILCDIGNTFLHFYYRGRVWKEKRNNLSQKDSSEVVIYISVNQESTRSLLLSHPYCFDLTPYMNLDTNYKGLGIDRIAACNAISDGVIIDAGSAITLDIMHDGLHLGGCILPGIAQIQKGFKSISVLDCGINLSVPLDTLPQNTKDAVSYGILKPIILLIENFSKNKKIYFTGGDGKFLSRFFENAIYDDLLIFKGMQNIITAKITSKGIYL